MEWSRRYYKEEQMNSTGGVNSEGRDKKGALVYEETFDQGPGAWGAGKNDEKGSWHRNAFGQRGEGWPLEWDPQGGRTGGCASSASPWYFDDNHGEFMWFHIVLRVPSTDDASIKGIDLRDADLEITLRGRNLDLKGTVLYFWLQGYGPEKGGFYMGDRVLYNWALTSQPIEQQLKDGSWHDVALTLHSDEMKWSQLGLIKGGLKKKIQVIQSRSVADGFLDGILNGNHHNFGFLLCGLDPNDLPSGRIEVDRIAILKTRKG